MKEADWPVSADLPGMLARLGGKASKRKLRLFACACCRHVWSRLKASGRRAVETSERYADDLEMPKELACAHRRAWGNGKLTVPQRAACAACTASVSVRVVAGHVELARSRYEASHVPGIYTGPWTFTCDLLREVFGNPFRRVRVEPAWLAWNGGAVSKLADAIYAERRFGDLPVLADALEEAGCTDAAILAHCRGDAEHVPGCWVLDLLLDKP